MAFEELLKVEKHKNMELKELEQLRAGLMEDIDYLYDRYADAKCSWQEYQELVKTLHQNIIENLLARKDNLAHVFISKLGSYYFILDSGHSWRIKADKDNWVSQPIMSKVFLIDEETAQKLLKLVSDFGASSIIDLKIKLADFKKGNSLLEIGAIHLPQPVIEKKADQIRISGRLNRETGKLEKDMGCGVHIGHQITAIIK